MKCNFDFKIIHDEEKMFNINIGFERVSHFRTNHIGDFGQKSNTKGWSHTTREGKSSSFIIW
jgi:hypothetical protein